MKTWNEIKSELVSDGSLRDIYILDTNIDDWNSFIQGVKQTKFNHDFFYGEIKEELPKSFQSIKSLQENNSTILTIFLEAGIQVKCHFFIDEEIEMDIDPREISNESAFNVLLSFLHWLAEYLKKTVYLTYENEPNQVILNVIPQNVFNPHV